MAKNRNKIHRKQIYESSNFKCRVCNRQFEKPLNWNGLDAIHDGEMYLEIDHIKPLSKGGSDTAINKQALCQKLPISRVGRLGRPLAY